MKVEVYDTEWGRVAVPESVLETARMLNDRFKDSGWKLNDKRSRGGKFLYRQMYWLAKAAFEKEWIKKKRKSLYD
jgi:hypothetical protein